MQFLLLLFTSKANVQGSIETESLQKCTMDLTEVYKETGMGLVVYCLQIANSGKP